MTVLTDLATCRPVRQHVRSRGWAYLQNEVHLAEHVASL